MKKHVFISSCIALLAIVCLASLVYLVSAIQPPTPASIIEDMNFVDEVYIDGSRDIESRGVIDGRYMINTTPRPYSSIADIPPFPDQFHDTPHTRHVWDMVWGNDFYFTNDEGETIHSSQRVMDVRSVEILFEYDILEYIPGTIQTHFHVAILATYQDGFQTVMHDTMAWYSSHELTWSSNNEQVISLIGSNVIVNGTGTARIAAEYGGIKGEKEVTVVEGIIQGFDLLVDGVEFWSDEIVMIQRGRSDDRNMTFMPQLSFSVYTTRGNRFFFPNESCPFVVSVDNPDIVAGYELTQNLLVSESSRGIFSETAVVNESTRSTGETYVEVSLPESMGQGTRRAEMLSAYIPLIALSADDIIGIEVIHYGGDLQLGFGSGLSANLVFECGRRFAIDASYAEWTSDNPEIINVFASGFAHINAIALGEATITATYAGLSDSITIRVIEEFMSDTSSIPFP